MSEPVEAILFDMGGTLGTTLGRDEAGKQAIVQRIMDLVGARGSCADFSRRLDERAMQYRYWARETLRELNEADLWTQWMLPEYPAELVAPQAVQLNQTWRLANGDRQSFPETREVILTLFRRGYRLGLISNTTSSLDAPRDQRELEIPGCFEVFILSCVLGKRKPDPEILLEAVRRMNLRPENCVYVGDRIDRDVEAARRAGFRMAILRNNPNRPVGPTQDPGLEPDHIITNLRELLEIFPGRQPSLPAAYRVSLSTMWARKNFPTLNDFCLAARRYGFGSIELNHQVTSEMLAEVDLSQFTIRSVHEPCPADISTVTLKERDWLISAPDEANRERGVHAVRRSIDLAHQLGVHELVVHCGNVTNDLEPEKELRGLFEAGKAHTEAYHSLKQQMLAERTRLAGPRLEAVKKSLLELLEYAAPFGIRLGLENRYHFMDIPNPDEMGVLLDLAGPGQLGFVYDVGHAQVLDRLGFYPHEAWLTRFASRISGVHLHDVIGITDHCVPGSGSVDFDRVAAYLPVGAFRTCELRSDNSVEQIRAGLQFLASRGCIPTAQPASQ